jgi:uncharacterized C2H2 Zn-finger protein
MYITIVCLNERCGNIFTVDTNGKTLRYYQKDHSIIDRKGKRYNCPKCGGLELKFKDYEKI